MKTENLGFCEFSFDESKEQFKDLIVKSLKEGYKRNAEFFGFELAFKIDFYYAREEFAQNYSGGAEYALKNKWLSAYANSKLKGRLFSLSPTVWEKESIHSLNNFSKTIGHEITHLFIHSIRKADLPFLFNEGLPYFLNNQVSIERLKKFISESGCLEFKDDSLSYSKALDECVGLYYQQSGSMFSWLMANFGKEKVLEFMKGTEEPLSNRFRKAFGISKEEFLEKWLAGIKKR